MKTPRETDIGERREKEVHRRVLRISLYSRRCCLLLVATDHCHLAALAFSLYLFRLITLPFAPFSYAVGDKFWIQKLTDPSLLTRVFSPLPSLPLPTRDSRFPTPISQKQRHSEHKKLKSNPEFRNRRPPLSTVPPRELGQTRAHATYPLPLSL